MKVSHPLDVSASAGDSPRHSDASPHQLISAQPHWVLKRRSSGFLDERDLFVPGRAPFGQPAGENSMRAALRGVEKAVAVHVEDQGCLHVALFGGGVQEALLMNTDSTHPRETVRVGDFRIGVIGDRHVCGASADPKLDRCHCDR